MKRILKTFCLTGVVLLGGALSSTMSPALAQADKKPAAAAAPAAAAPADNQQTLQMTTSGWQTRCGAKDRKAPLECVVEASAVLNNNGQRLTDFSVRIPDAKAAPVMMVRVPLEVQLTAGVNLKVDEGKVFSYPLQTCNNNGCFLGNPLDQDLLAAMIKGKNIVVSFKDTVQNDIRLTLPLDGFGDAFNAVK